TVNVPQADSASALTTTRPRPASAITTMNRTANPATTPDNGLISVRAISASDLPLRLTLATKIIKSCTAPPKVTPITSHHKPDKNPNCAASTGPIRGPAPEMAAK